MTLLRNAARMVESVDTRDLKSLAPEGACGFKSRFEYQPQAGFFVYIWWLACHICHSNESKTNSPQQVTICCGLLR